MIAKVRQAHRIRIIGIRKNLFKQVVASGINQQIIEQRSTWINVRPSVLAVWLLEDWYKLCDDKRLTSIARDIVGAPFGRLLIDAFGKRFSDMPESASAQKLVAYRSSCASVADAARVDSIVLETPNRILADNEVNANATIGNVNFATSGAEFKPKQGLSAAPFQGFFAVQYGGRGVFGAAVKLKDRNTFIPMMKFEDSNWSGI